MSDWWAHFWINVVTVGCMGVGIYAIWRLWVYPDTFKEWEELQELERLQASWDAQWSEALREAHRR